MEAPNSRDLFARVRYVPDTRGTLDINLCAPGSVVGLVSLVNHLAHRDVPRAKLGGSIIAQGLKRTE
jgi:hypothetical protein